MESHQKDQKSSFSLLISVKSGFILFDLIMFCIFWDHNLNSIYFSFTVSSFHIRVDRE